ncbi:hypothetical protein BBC0244_011190 [Bartonella apihabitans]|uniref:hypothetical protein n=1 Tax=Bartonella apihabitans TaxID=2750929 RepID=UPI0009C3151D|nr:hypothetical protein [Bartonella apihabitans]AQT44826.1 hypothetical protein BBC0244_011190 [Bartonella apihabitans]
MKSVDHSFDKKIEKFKGELRESEKEIEQIRTFLISAKSHADLAVQTKRIDAAENLLQNLNILSQFSPVIEVLRSIHIDKALQYGSGTNNDFLIL